MKHLFFIDTAETEQKGTQLAPAQVQTLKQLIEAVCSQQVSLLACQIGTRILNSTNWQKAKVMLESVLGEQKLARLHINLPGKGLIGQVEIYSWVDEQEGVRVGVGTAGDNEFALVALPDGQARALAARLLEQGL